MSDFINNLKIDEKNGIVKLTGKKADLEKAKEIGITEKVINKLKVAGLVALTSLAFMLPNANAHAEIVAGNNAPIIQVQDSQTKSISGVKKLQAEKQDVKNIDDSSFEKILAQKTEAQKSEMAKFYKYILKNKIDPNNKEQIKIVKDHIFNMAKLELEKSGHVFDKEGNELTRDFEIRIFEKSEEYQKKFDAESSRLL